jgi:hypothetical protein
MQDQLFSIANKFSNLDPVHSYHAASHDTSYNR